MILCLLWGNKCLTEELSVFNSKDKGLTIDITVDLRFGCYKIKGETFYFVWSPSNHIWFVELLI